jgi:hypothetical protein
MTIPILLYHPAPFGSVLHRLDCAAADPAAEGRRLAAVMRDVPAGSRAVLCNDWGGGRSPDQFHLWTAKDADGRLVPLTVEQSERVWKWGSRSNSEDMCQSWMRDCVRGYVAKGGPPLDFLAANVELRPDGFLPSEASFQQVREWRSISAFSTQQEAKDELSWWASAQLAEAVHDCLNQFPATTRVNLGACDFHGPRRDHNGQIFGNAAPCGVSSPFLYLTETVTPNITPDSVLCHNIETWRAVKSPKVVVLGPPHWGGEDVAKVPGCTRRRFTFTGGESRDFFQKDVKVWFPRWEALAREVAKDAAAIVCWWNMPPHGPAPSAAELAAMARVLGEVSQ